MAIHGLVSKAGAMVVTGAVGAVAYDVARAAVSRAPWRDGAVVATSWGLRGTRKAEDVAERVRLETADIVAEARDRIGEQAPPPGAAEPHDHEH